MIHISDDKVDEMALKILDALIGRTVVPDKVMIKLVKEIVLKYNEGNTRSEADLVSTIKSLQKDSSKLFALEEAGVDNWNGYVSAMDVLCGEN